jgi:23S rRNA (cytidine1920-2'-O)/16S rRNA (cytidine1409-2'-O)-methyltransferase
MRTAARMTPRRRADLVLVERGLFESRTRARAAIAAGRVKADGVVVRKPSAEIAVGAVLDATSEHPFVSRGGVKLDAALKHFGLDPADSICLDVGASTGGFTEVLLQRGARQVYAVDVGRGQLHERLRSHPRVLSLEATDIRNLGSGSLPVPPDFVVIDVSFISLTHALPPALRLAKPPASLIALIKPQFEAGRADVKKGVVREAAIHEAICNDIAAFLADQGWRVGGRMPSPILGGDGNREFFIEAERG